MLKDMISKINNSTFYSSLKYFNDIRKKGLVNHKKFLELTNIINNESLSTFFQPILDLNGGNTIGFEILNRPPSSKMFPTTESFYDFIGQTDQVFSFECFCRNLSIQRYFNSLSADTLCRDNLIFLNIHPQVLLDSNYKSGETVQLLQEFGISPEQVVFELTEKQAVTDFVQFEKVLNNYRSQGFRIAIDDAGSGYNSLKTLVYLKPEFIKLDKSLIRHIDQDSVQQKLVSMLLDFANQSDTFVIAEGIEEAEELVFLQKNGVHFGQGYGLGKPHKTLITGKLPQVPSLRLING
ncbi:EAL domain-containing protein [Falsibacillus albus]|uniref:EAL domain-containing protein n=1 Tax=Falsibacillus albus TaxID=2478915 RepID=A0A3L7JVD1_9BACI|nr:EAL domain-containing protein [Falsibacillus albus]RLQ94265.1 EAL domain-containing protein [Falsibacillus albus]